MQNNSSNPIIAAIKDIILHTFGGPGNDNSKNASSIMLCHDSHNEYDRNSTSSNYSDNSPTSHSSHNFHIFRIVGIAIIVRIVRIVILVKTLGLRTCVGRFEAWVARTVQSA